MNRFVEFRDFDCTIDEHHKHPALGSTSLKRYLTDRVPTQQASDVGNAVHALVVDQRPDMVIERPAFSGKGSRAEKAAWEAEHTDVYHFAPAELRQVLAMAEALKSTRSLMQLLEHPAVQVEHTVLAKTDTDIWAKARVDIRGQGTVRRRPVRIMVDIKTTGEADDEDFARTSVPKYGYDVQAALYGDIECQRHGIDVIYWLYAVQKTPPYRVMRMRVTDEWMHLGRMLYEAAFLKAEIERVTGIRPELHWEGDRVLPPPKKWHAERAERIIEHARRLADMYLDR